MSEDQHLPDTKSPGLPNLEALSAWARDTAEPFDLVERILVLEAPPSLSPSGDSAASSIKYVMAVEILGMPEDPQRQIEDGELRRTVEQWGPDCLKRMLAHETEPVFVEGKSELRDQHGSFGVLDSWLVRPCAPDERLLEVEDRENWVLFDRRRIVGIDRSNELAATARKRQDVPLSEAEREKYVARLEARERASSRAYRCDELIRRWNLFESQLSHCFVLGLPPYRLDESGTLVPVLSAEPLTSTMRETAWQALSSVIRKDAPKRFERAAQESPRASFLQGSSTPPYGESMFFAMGYFRLEVASECQSIERSRDDLMEEHKRLYVLREDAEKFERDFGLGTGEVLDVQGTSVALGQERPALINDTDTSGMLHGDSSEDAQSKAKRKEALSPHQLSPSKRRWKEARLEVERLKMKEPGTTLQDAYDSGLVRMPWRGRNMPTLSTFEKNMRGVPGFESGRPKKK